jgi:cyanophycinase
MKLNPINFFVGGDQNEYMTYWVGTQVQTIIQSKLANVTVGGTSAGLAVLGNWVYTAEDGSVYSDEALAVRECHTPIIPSPLPSHHLAQDPYNKYMDIAPAFLRIPFLETVITDTHFGLYVRIFSIFLTPFCSDKGSDGTHAVFRGSRTC